MERPTSASGIERRSQGASTPNDLGVRKQCHFAALDCFRNERKRHQVVEGLPNGHEFQSLQPFLAGERIGARKQFVTNAVEQLDSRRDEAAHRALFCRCQRRGNAAALAMPDDNDVIDFEPCDRKRDSGGCAMVPAVFPVGRHDGSNVSNDE